jgi:hypothetical protein
VASEPQSLPGDVIKLPSLSRPGSTDPSLRRHFRDYAKSSDFRTRIPKAFSANSDSQIPILQEADFTVEIRSLRKVNNIH